jgi:hypothetical protein
VHAWRPSTPSGSSVAAASSSGSKGLLAAAEPVPGRLKLPKDIKVASATVRVNGRRKALVKGAKLKQPIDLRRLPKRTFTVSITIKATDGRSDTTSKRYTACN